MRILLFVIFLFSFNSSFSQKSNTELTGDIIQIVLPATAGVSTVLFKGEDKGTLQFVKSFATMEIVTHATKRIINKERPNGGKHAFPSGHTAASFMGASFLQKRYGWDVGIPAYLLASYVGYTRIEANKHDIYDVIGGVLVGTASSYIFVKPLNNSGSLNADAYSNSESFGLIIELTIN